MTMNKEDRNFPEIEFEYEEIDGIRYPKIQISRNPEADNQSLGKYGQMALNYLKEEHPHRYSYLLSEGILMETMHKVNDEAHQRLEMYVEQMLKTDPAPNPEDWYETYRHKETIRASAEEIMLEEIVYIQR